MATITTDLVTLAVGNTTTDAGSWIESANGGYDDGGAPGSETDFYIENSQCVSAQFTKTGVGSILFQPNTFPTINNTRCWFIWWYWASPPSLATRANGGVSFHYEVNGNNLQSTYIGGSDVDPSPYGGWYQWVANMASPTTNSGADNIGILNNWTSVGINVNASAQARGYPFALGSIRYGTGLTAVSQASDVISLSTIEAVVNTNSFRSGLLTKNSPSTYIWVGAMNIGNGSTTTIFTESNKSVIIPNQRTRNSSVGTFTKLVTTANSTTTLTNVNFNNAGPDFATENRDRGSFIFTDGSVIMTDSSFTETGPVTLGASTSLSSTAFRFTNGAVAASGASLSNCTFRGFGTNVTTGRQLSVQNLNQISSCNFIGDTTNHANLEGVILAPEITSDTAMTWNSTYSGFSATSSVTSGGTTALSGYPLVVNVASGVTLTINVTGGTAPIYKNTGAGSVVIAESYTLSLTNIVAGSEVRIFAQSDLTEQGGGIEQIGITTPGSGWAAIAEDSPPTRYTATYTYPYSTDVPVFITVLDVEYEIVREADTLNNSSRSIKINQIFDRVYDEGDTPYVNP